MDTLSISPVPRKNHVSIHVDGVDKSMRVLRRMLQQEGFFRDIKLKRYHESNSQKRKRKLAESMKRWSRSKRRRS